MAFVEDGDLVLETVCGGQGDFFFGAKCRSDFLGQLLKFGLVGAEMVYQALPRTSAQGTNSIR